MPTIRFSRPFASGSRPTPDPFDKFLDSHGFYRKHTPRDASNLFRVISEQLYDTQDHHKQIRKDCVNFMIKHRDQYALLVMHEPFEQYIQRMSKNETFGTLIELRAMGYLFKRNIILYEPFDLGTPLIDEAEYTEPVLRVFHATHFDAVYEKSYIMDAAFCQSVVYEMLYKKVFKLPDIEYSVETMLHSDINHEPSKHEYEHGDCYASHIIFEDGRKFELDRPETTNCILSDPERCHFHNKDFEEVVKRDSRRFEKSILSDKYNSCVRQLLFDGITPFPYKVAKALDQNIYRNVEFDSWNEERKLSKQKQNYYKVGVECLVKLCDENDELLKCRIQAKIRDDLFIVFIDKLAEKRSVSCESLRPLIGAPGFMKAEAAATAASRHATFPTRANTSIDRIASDMRSVKSHMKCQSIDGLSIDYDAICNSFDFESYLSLSNFHFASHNQPELIACPMVYSQSGNMGANSNTSGQNAKNNKNRQSNAAQNNSNCGQSDVNDKAQAKGQDTDGNSYGKSGHEIKVEVQQAPTPTTGYYQHQTPDPNAAIDAGPTPMSNYYQPGIAPFYYCAAPTEYSDQGVYSSDMVMQPSVYAIPAPYQAPPMQPMYAPIAGNQTTHYPVPVSGWPAQPINPQGYVVSGAPPYAVPTVPSPVQFPWPFLSRELLRSNGRINFNPNYSFSPNADDLPLQDKISVRFYYNLGIEYFKLLQQVHGHGAVMAMIDGDVGSGFDQQSTAGDVDQLGSEFQHFNIEQNDIEIQSPSKPRNYNDNNYRRNSNIKYQKRNDRPNVKHFQGIYQGPTKTFMKNNQKYNQSGNNNNYDSTPMKDNGTKQHQHGHNQSKRDQQNLNIDIDNGNGNTGFGSNVPPFPYTDGNEQHFVPPGNPYARMTPPGSMRPSPVPVAQYHQSNHHMYGNYWMQNPPPSVYNQPQSQAHQTQPNSLNTSSASNPSQ